MSPVDPEIDVIDQCLHLLLRLDPRTRARVIDYLEDRLIDSHNPMPGSRTDGVPRR